MGPGSLGPLHIRQKCQRMLVEVPPCAFRIFFVAELVAQHQVVFDCDKYVGWEVIREWRFSIVRDDDERLAHLVEVSLIHKFLVEWLLTRLGKACPNTNKTVSVRWL